MLPVLKQFGDDVMARLPHGQENDRFAYFAEGEFMSKVREALREAGLPEANYPTVDLFLYWVGQREKTPEVRTGLFQSLPERQDLVYELRHQQSSTRIVASGAF